MLIWYRHPYSRLGRCYGSILPRPWISCRFDFRTRLHEASLDDVGLAYVDVFHDTKLLFWVARLLDMGALREDFAGMSLCRALRIYRILRQLRYIFDLTCNSIGCLTPSADPGCSERLLTFAKSATYTSAASNFCLISFFPFTRESRSLIS
jgi:hypothetical protein